MNNNQGKIRILIATALQDQVLKNLCFDHFRPVYDAYEQASRDELIRKLVIYANSQSRIEELLNLVKEENFQAYQDFTEEIKEQRDMLNQQPISHNFPELLNFDLDSLVSEGINKIIEGEGLIGLSIHCKERYLATYFCQRLQQRLGRKNSTIIQPITINYFKTFEQAFNDIKGHQKKLKNHDVICLIKVDISNDNSTALQNLWDMLYKEFKNTLEHNLIIIMVSAKKCVFPQDVSDLKSPIFQKADAQQWISGIIAKMQPAEEWSAVEDHWLKIMIRQCEGSDPNSLDISGVYDHLRVTLDWLKESKSPHEFLQKF